MSKDKHARTPGPHTKLEAFNAGLAAAYKVRDVEVSALTADNAMLREALVACCAAIAPIREGERNGAVFGNLSRADDQARAALARIDGAKDVKAVR